MTNQTAHINDAQEIARKLNNDQGFKAKGMLATQANGVVRIYGPKRKLLNPNTDHLMTIKMKPNGKHDFTSHGANSLPYKLAVASALGVNLK